ncbi:hypothetical protein B0H94_11168 [Salsuginibacillus halophilus]|uniref:Lipoprotein n=1 Tax=Salsuginibacillus halophilus TaxID=517424 RepID=A0A2P8HAK9_9BACI|nr:hypothetical protein [Salsuginibacillus halophilus]PSL43244.1 hypothetical protein B0H94_11168 [Salsuginibacillus halophilus]
MKRFTIYATCMLILLGCSHADSLERDPDISGEVLEIDAEESRFLMEGPGSLAGDDDGSAKVWFTSKNPGAHKPMFDEDGNDITLEDLTAEDNVKVWAQDEVLLDSDPAQGSVEHLIVLKMS